MFGNFGWNIIKKNIKNSNFLFKLYYIIKFL